MKHLIIISGLILSLSQIVLAKDKQISFTQVLYQESTPGVGSYPYRILVNDQFVRFDGGGDQESYILFDRALKKVISVNHNDRSRFIIQPLLLEEAKAEKPKSKVDVQLTHKAIDNSPQVQNKVAEMHEVIADEILCRQVISFAGLMPEVTKAWAEYEDIMQLQNGITQAHTPQDMQTPCFIANNITHASEYLKFGLPYSIKSKDGTVRILQGFSEVTKPEIMVTPPSEYRQFTL